MSPLSGGLPGRGRCAIVGAELTCLILLVLGACGRAPAPEHTGEVTPTVLNSERPPQEWQLVEEGRFGRRQNHGVGDLVTDRAGRVYARYTDGAVWVFTADGRRERVWESESGRTRGRPVHLGGLSWGPDGLLWGVDPGARRFVAIDSLGRVAGEIPRRSNADATRWGGGYDRRGTLYDEAFAPGARPVLVRLGQDGTALDTLHLPHVEREIFWRGPPVVGEDGGPAAGPRPAVAIRGGMRVPLTPQTVWRFDPAGYVWLARTDEYRVYKTTLRGDTVLAFGRAHTPVPVTPLQKDSIRREYELLLYGARVDTARIPSVRPVFQELLLGDCGTVWVRLTDSRERPTTFDVFDSGGRYLARARTDARIEVGHRIEFRGDALFYAGEEDDHAEGSIGSVVRARIRRTGAPDGSAPVLTCEAGSLL